jgi:hypothetical protein
MNERRMSATTGRKLKKAEWNMSDRSFPSSPGVASAERALRLARISFVFALLAPTFVILGQLLR